MQRSKENIPIWSDAGREVKNFLLEPVHATMIFKKYRMPIPSFPISSPISVGIITAVEAGNIPKGVVFGAVTWVLFSAATRIIRPKD